MSRYNIPISRSQPHMGVYLDSEDDTYYWFREAVPDQGTSVRQTVAKGNAHATGRPSNSRRYDQQGAHGFQYSASPSRDQPPPLTSVHVPSTTRGNEQQQVITLLRSECVHDLYFIEANFKDSGENQPFLLALDTGARDSWIYGRSCKALPPPDNDGIFQYGKNVKPAVDWYQVPQRNPLDEKPVHNKFDLNKDTHRAVRGTVPTLMIYADGTAVELGLVKTTITLLPWGAHAAESALRNPLLGYRPIVIEDFHIGVARAASSKIAQKKFHGILGLAPSTQRSIFDGKNDKIVISSIIERLKGNKAANVEMCVLHTSLTNK
ncbi:hypothetical protein K474DRAFT_569281 [Panus rudis PR-1116 ss-1]|nr:hypothetical protein K474DRAFT_569281 [Panus rudis PR-1116 ss-1]